MIRKLFITIAFLLFCSSTFAATYYADFDLGTGDNDGTTAANAWQTMQRAVDGTGGTQPTAGDIVYCTGTDTLAANLDLDGLTGDETSGMVRWIGVSDLTPTNDGTRAVINGADTYTCTAATTDFWHFENFEFTQMSGSGIDSATSPDWWVFINCSFNNNNTHGVNGTELQKGFFIRCAFYANGSHGVFKGDLFKYFFCSFHDNTGSGINNIFGSSVVTLIGCLIYDNGNDGIDGLSDNMVVFNCVINGNTDDGIAAHVSSSVISVVIGCRITNHSGAGDIGLNANGEIVFHGWNYYEDNDGNNIQNNALALEILNNGSGTDVEDQADTNEGYVSKTDGSEDFNLRSDATSRRTAITIPTN